MTLLEISAVMVIGALLAASVIPAMSRADDARRGAGVVEAERLLTYARERAIASGMPVGAGIDAGAGTIELWTITPGQAPTVLATPLGEPTPAALLTARFGVAIERVEIPLGAGPGAGGASSVLWFDHAGVPHARDENGTFVGTTVGDTEIRFGHGPRILAKAVSGLVETVDP
jgi:hypothetical protein